MFNFLNQNFFLKRAIFYSDSDPLDSALSFAFTIGSSSWFIVSSLSFDLSRISLFSSYPKIIKNIILQRETITRRS